MLSRKELNLATSGKYGSTMSINQSTSELAKLKRKNFALSVDNLDAIDQLSDSSSLTKYEPNIVRRAKAKKHLSDDDAKRRRSWYLALNRSASVRTKQLKKYFRDLPADEDLLIDFSCALQRDILVHGRMYATLNYMCFHSNIFSFETTLIIAWKDIKQITKDKVAKVIPNALQISTDSKQLFFGSFMSRRRTYKILTLIWENAMSENPANFEQMKIIIDIDRGSNGHQNDSFETNITEVDYAHTDLESTAGSIPEESFEEAQCDQPHEGRKLIDEVLPISIDKLYHILFVDNSFFNEFHTSRRSGDIKISEWKEGEHGTKVRNISMYIQLTIPIGPKTAGVDEIQILYPCSRPRKLYSIDSEVMNHGVPYADSFSLYTHYCLTSVSKNETNFASYSRVLYKKSVMFVAKKIIDKNGNNGLEDFYAVYIKAIRARVQAVTFPKKIISTEETQEQKTDENNEELNVTFPYKWYLLAIFFLVSLLLYIYLSWNILETETITVIPTTTTTPPPVIKPPVLDHIRKTENKLSNLMEEKEQLIEELEEWKNIIEDAITLFKRTKFSIVNMQNIVKSIYNKTVEKHD